MKTSDHQVDNVYFSFKKIKYLSSLLFGSISLGVIMSIFMSYRAFGFGLSFYRDLLCLSIVSIIAILYHLNYLKLTTALSIIAYFILTFYFLILPFLFEVEGFSFYSYFLEIQFLVMLFGLILTIGVRPYHDLVLGSINLLFSTICVFLVQEFQVETYLFYVSIVTAKCLICFVIFENVFKLRRRMKAHHETIIRQNAELLELTNFRKDIIRIIAHDLRNPIHQISSLLEVVEDSETEKERSDIMGFLKKSVDNAYDLLENLLNWAMQNNEALRQYKMIDLNALIVSIENQLTNQIEQKKLTIEKRISPGTEIFYSRNVIELVARNLMVNAVKFSPSNQQVIVSFENRDTSFRLMFFNKSKTKELENIAQYNAGMNKLNSTKGTANEMGSGNGLKVCREMLEKNKGVLTLTTEENGVLATVLVNKVL